MLQGRGPARAWMLAWLARSSGTSVSQACACFCSAHSSALAAGRRAAATTCTRGSRASSCGAAQQSTVFVRVPQAASSLLAGGHHTRALRGSSCSQQEQLFTSLVACRQAERVRLSRCQQKLLKITAGVEFV